MAPAIVLRWRALPAIVFAALAFAAIPAHADKSAPAPVAKTADQLKPAEPDEATLQTHGHYKNKAGEVVHSPAKSTTQGVPSGASAKCGDGSYSFSKNHRGTCSHHGGVARWL